MSYKISIIIPVYNAAEFIVEDTLKSIENQTMDFKDIEVVLVNDCSSDNTEEVINEYAKDHPNILPIHLRENSGDPAKPRNIGIMYANADYLMFLDQDDKFRKNACERLYDKITSENVDLVCGNHMMVSGNNSYVAFKYEWMDSNEIKIDSIEENPEFLTMSYAIWSKIYRKSFIIENNIKFTSGVGEDLFFLLRSFLLAEGIILIKNLFVVDYNLRNDSLSHQIDKDYVLEFTEFYLDFFDYCDDNVEKTLYEKLFNGRLTHYFSILLFPDLFFDEMSEIFSKVKELFCNLNKHDFKLNNQLHQLLFYSIINDDCPFENSIMLYSMLKNNMTKKFNNSIKYYKQEAKLYVDCGKGFNEKECVIENYMISDSNKIRFNLTSFKNIKNLRFDPISSAFINCTIKNIQSNVDKMEINAMNAFKNNNFIQTFLTTDSQYMLNGDFNNIEYVEVTFSIEILESNQIAALIS